MDQNSIKLVLVMGWMGAWQVGVEVKFELELEFGCDFDPIKLLIVEVESVKREYKDGGQFMKACS